MSNRTAGLRQLRCVLQFMCAVTWALVMGIGALLLLSEPKIIPPSGELAPGSHSLGIDGGLPGRLYRHQLQVALKSPQFADLDVVMISRIGHVRLESEDAILLPVKFRDTVALSIKGPPAAKIELASLHLRRELLPGAWVLFGAAGMVLVFLHWLVKEPFTRQKVFKATLLVGSSVMAVLFLTLGLQWVGSRLVAEQDWRLFPPFLNESIYILPEVTPGIPEGVVWFKTNREGIRARERGPDFENTFSVLCIGASTTEGLLLGEENHWPRVLEKRLQQVKGTNVWVGNAGHSGFSTAKLVLVASNYVPRIKPKVVVVLTGFNEGIVPENRQERHAAEPAPEGWEALKDQLLKLRIVRLVKYTLFNYAGRSPNDVDMSGDTSGYKTLRRQLQEHARRYPARARGWEDLDLSGFEQSLRTLAGICKESGCRFILCTQPTIYRDDLKPEEEQLLWMMGNYTPGSKRHRMDRINNKLRGVAKQLGVQVVDLDRELPRTTEVFYDDCHFNVEGARRVAELVFEQCFR
jgi:hypothetical protein